MSKFVAGDKANGFWCKRCGKAGFKSKAAVIGHQPHCEGVEGLYEDFQQGRESLRDLVMPALELKPKKGQAPLFHFDPMQGTREEIEARLGNIEKMVGNHLTHLGQAQATRTFDYKDMLWAVGLGVLGGMALGYLLKGGEEPGGKKGKAQLGDKLLSKASSKMLDKAFNKFL